MPEIVGKLKAGLGWTKLVWHSFTTGPMSYVQEKLDEAGVKIVEHTGLQESFDLLRQQQRLFKIFNYFWLVFTVVFYWAIVQSIVSSALEATSIDPSWLNLLKKIVLILTPVSIPGLMVFSKLKTAMYNDMHNTKAYCLGYIARLAGEAPKAAPAE